MTKLKIIVNGKEISFSQDEFRYAKKRHSLQELNRQKETLLQGATSNSTNSKKGRTLQELNRQKEILLQDSTSNTVNSQKGHTLQELRRQKEILLKEAALKEKSKL